MNRPVDAATADVLAAPGLFVEAIAAPDFEPAAFEILTTRPKWKANVRLLAVGAVTPLGGGWDLRSIVGGLLVQAADVLPDPEAEWTTPTRRGPTDAERAELRFAWNVVRCVKSNAIVVTRDRTLLGAGAGQMSRVDSVEIALRKAGERGRGGVIASDAFFPFPDSIELAARAGITALIQPGGSKNDPAVVEACDRHGLTMLFTGRRHFRH
jgi:phosphoribosylaminoimidazolecarboxamide formyltransferase/IMP cyclohydrolase